VTTVTARDSSIRLTLILTTKGRDDYTLRYLEYLNGLAASFHVLIGDGAPDPVVSDMIADGSAFPNVSYEYRRYGDTRLIDFYRKCSDLADRVTTPYAMMMDNDDFIVPFGVQRQINILDANPAFASSGGRTSGLSVWPDSDGRMIGGKIRAFTLNYKPNYDYSNNATSGRAAAAVNVAGLGIVNYYRVFRTDALRTILRDICELNTQSLLLHELFFSMRAESLGVNHYDSNVVYLVRQAGTSHAAARVDGATALLKHIFQTNASNDLKSISERVFDAVQPETMSAGEFFDRLAEAYSRALVGTLTALLAGTFATESRVANFLLRGEYLVLKRLLSAARALFNPLQRSAQLTAIGRLDRALRPLRGPAASDEDFSSNRAELLRLCSFVERYRSPLDNR
jgi:glycosyltransferase domain-containing protein